MLCCHIQDWALAAPAAKSLSTTDLTMAAPRASWSAIWAVPTVSPLKTPIITIRDPRWTLSNATTSIRTANRLNTTRASAWSADHMADMFNIEQHEYMSVLT